MTMRFFAGLAVSSLCDGSALVLHSGADDYESRPSGDAGNRQACAVIEKG
jgi:Cu-Zn family superoxide dismutase